MDSFIVLLLTLIESSSYDELNAHCPPGIKANTWDIYIKILNRKINNTNVINTTSRINNIKLIYDRSITYNLSTIYNRCVNWAIYDECAKCVICVICVICDSHVFDHVITMVLNDKVILL